SNTDTQIGLLGGVAFSLVNAVIGIPLGRMADSSSRKWLLIGCVSVWSLMTAMGGLARNFVQLAATRAGVAIAEAGCSPASHSMIADLFPDRRGFALGLYTAGVPAGIMTGLALGGVLVDLLDWRTVLFIFGIPGAVLAVAFLIAREPPRRPRAHGAAPRRTREALAVLISRRSYVWMALAATLNSMSGAAAAAFGAAYLMRTFHFSATQAGISYGVMSGTVSVAGMIVAGAIGDRIARTDPSRRLRFLSLVLILAAPCFITAILAPVPQMFFVFIALNALLQASFLPMTFAAAQAVVTSDMRATASAVMLFTFTIGGAMTGPILVGVISDRLLPIVGEQRALGHALACLGVMGFLAAAAFWIAARRHNADVEAVALEEAPALA
ncbi:MAG: transporter, family, hexuronate transporter, partial [Phenylobacterium sp.]|nr:transporter, family, hexuronate transporter [Phenylobacterium sp.]